MNQIKKFAWSGSSVAIAALLAVALLVTGPLSTANADVGAVTPAPAVIPPGGTSTVSAEITTASDVTFIIESNSTATGVWAGTGTVALTCDITDGAVEELNCNDGAATVDITGGSDGPVTATLTASSTSAQGQINVRVIQDADSQAATVFVVGSAPTAATVTFTDPLVLTTGASDEVEVNVENASAVDLDNATVTFSVTGPGSVYRTSAASTACSATASGVLATTCTENTAGGGLADAFVQSTGASGTVTVTATSGSASASSSSTVAGPAAAIEIISVNQSNPGASGNSVVSARLTDAAGNPVPGTSVTFTVPAGSPALVDDATDCTSPTVTQTATTGSTGATLGVATVRLCATSTAAAGSQVTITARPTASTTITDTETVTISGPPAAVAITSADASVPVGGSTSVTFAVTDADGAPARAGTTVDVATTAGVLAGCSDAISTTAGLQVSSTGTITCTFVAPGTAQTVTLTAVATSGTAQVVQTQALTVGGATPPPSGGDGTFTGDVAASGSSLVVWNGGTNAELAAAAAAEGAISVFVTVNGEFVGYIVGAPAFVNATFTALFPEGVPAGTPVILTK